MIPETFRACLHRFLGMFYLLVNAAQILCVILDAQSIVLETRIHVPELILVVEIPRGEPLYAP